MNRRNALALLGAAALVAVSDEPAFASPEPIRIGRYTFAGPGTVNTWWIETPRSVIVIDLQRDLPHAREALAAVQAIGKPVVAAIITHGHPDHYAGLGLFKAEWPTLVAYGSQVTRDTIENDDYGFNALLQQAGPDVFPAQVTAPDRIIVPGETLIIDGVRIQTREFGPSDANSMTVLYVPQTHDLFPGDIVLSGMHAFLYEGASAELLASLRRLKREYPRARTLHPGHGEPGRPRALINAEITYVETARAIARNIIATHGAGPEGQAMIVEALRTGFPDLGNPVGLPNFLDLSVAGLARELSDATPSQS